MEVVQALWGHRWAWRTQGGLPKIEPEFSKQKSLNVDLMCTSLFIH